MKHLNFNFKSIVLTKARYLATLALLLTLGVGQMWANNTASTFYLAVDAGTIAGDYDNVKFCIKYSGSDWTSWTDMTRQTGVTYKGRLVYKATYTFPWDGYHNWLWIWGGTMQKEWYAGEWNTNRHDGEIYVYDTETWETYSADESYTVYFVNKDSWTTPKAYAWSSDYIKSVANYSSSATMTKTDYTYEGHDIYSITYPMGYKNIIFNDNASDSKKTSDLECYVNRNQIYNGTTWHTYGRDITVYAIPEDTHYSYATAFDPSTHNLRANVKIGDNEWLGNWPIFSKTSYKYDGKWIYKATVLAKYSVIKIIQFWEFTGDYKTSESSFYNCNPASQYTIGNIDGKIFGGWVNSAHTWYDYGTDVALDRQGGTTGSTSITATVGSAMPSATMASGKTGYTFAGYFSAVEGGGTQYYNADGSSANNWVMDGPQTLYAKWTANEYTISLNANGGTAGAVTSVKVTYDSYPADHTFAAINGSVAANLPTKDGYYLDGWYTGEGGTGEKLISDNGYLVWNTAAGYLDGYTDTDGNWKKADNITLYARWKANSSDDNYTLSYGSGTRYGSGWTIVPFAQVGETSEWNASFTLPDPESKPKYFVGFEEDFYRTAYLGINNAVSVEANMTALMHLPSNEAIGTATGATGTLVLWDNSAEDNLYVGFKPDGYGITYNSATAAFTETNPATNLWETEPITLVAADVSGNFQVKLATSSSYTTCALGTSETKTAVDGRNGDRPDLAAGQRGKFRIWVNSSTNNFALDFIPVYSVSFDMQGHGSSIDAYPTIDHGALIGAPSAPEATGYTFGGWYKEAACTNAWNFSTDVITKDTTLYAKWTADSYDVTLNMQGVGSNLTPEVTYDNTALTGYTAPSNVRSGALLGYYTAAGSGTKVLDADGTFAASTVDGYITGGKWTKTSATELYAHWVAVEGDTLNISNYVDYGGGVTLDADSLNYRKGGSNHTDGYAEWQVDIKQQVYNVTIKGSYYAGNKWELYLINSSGSTAATCTFDRVDNKTVRSESKQWNLTSLSEGVYTLKAKNILEWAEPKLLHIVMDPITVTYDANGGSCATESAAYTGSALTLPTPSARSGYVFEGWYNSDTKIGAAGGSYSPTASITLTARWGEILDLPTTLTKANVGTYSDDMEWYGDDEDYFDYGSEDHSNTERWARWEVNVVPCKYTISWVSDYTLPGSDGIKWGLILFDGADTVAVYTPDATTWSKKEFTYPTQWDLTEDKDGNALAAGAYTLEVKNILSHARPKLKSMTLMPTLYTITYDGGTYGTGSLAADEKIGCHNLTLSDVDDAFTRTSYYTYDGWSTNADGSTKDYTLGDTYDTDEDVTLYPHWVLDCSEVQAPTNFTAGDILDVGVTFTITDAYDAASYDIYYSEESDAPEAGTTPSTSSTSKTVVIDDDLEPETTYYAWVRAVCADGTSKSDWVALNPDGDTHTFTTVETVYAITLGTVTTFKRGDPADGGSIAASGASAAEGAEVTLTATPESGYGFKAWKIEKTSDNSDVTNTLLGPDSTNTSASFSMPAYGVTVKATFATRYRIYYREADNITTIEGMEPDYYLYRVGVAELPTPTKAGYTFAGWYSKYCVYDDPDGSAGEGGKGFGWVNGCKKTSIENGAGTYGDYILLAKWTPVTLTFKKNAASSDWFTASNWDPACVPTIEHDVVIKHRCWVERYSNAQAKSVEIHNYGDGDTEGYLYIYSGLSYTGGLVVAEGITAVHSEGDDPEATTEDDLWIDTDQYGNGGLICGGASANTQARYYFYTKAYKYSSTYYINQYVGIPFATTSAYDLYDFTIFVYDDDVDDWRTPTGESASTLQAWTAYNLIRQYGSSTGWNRFRLEGTLNLPGTTEDGRLKTFTCGSRYATEAADPVNAGHAYFDNGGDHLFANSWTAPIDISSIDGDDMDGDDFVQTIYIFNAGYESGYSSRVVGDLSGQWSAYPIHSSSYMGGAVIPATQAFLVTSLTTNASFTLDYKKHVYDPALASGINTTPTKAPRRQAANNEPNVLKITVHCNDTTISDVLYLFEREDFNTDALDNGWDGYKIAGENYAAELYTIRGNAHMAVDAVADMNNTNIAFKASVQDNEYTFSFDYSENAEVLYLYDKVTGIYTRVLTGNTYTFTTADHAEHARFILTRTASQTPTGIGNVQGDDVQSTKFIENEHLYILRGGVLYDATGRRVK